jgi:membrane-bound lytic murein transglycosylase A
MSLARRCVAFLMFSVIAGAFAGCKSHNAQFIDPFAGDVDTKTPGWGLRKLDPKDYPDMRAAWMDQKDLEKAINHSLSFLAKDSTTQFYPSTNPGDTITHRQVQATLQDTLSMLRRGLTPDQFQQEILTRYDVYTSVGYNNKGDVWYTAYFTPYYYGSKTRTGEFQYPIYSRPSDLVTDPITGKVMGSYPTRRELVSSGKLRGLELLYFKNPMEPFMIQVQGSAKVILPDRSEVLVGYAGSNDREHKGLGTQLRDEGKVDARHLSLPAVIDYFDKHPGELDTYVLKDDRFVFMKIYSADEAKNWPTGSLNEQVTDFRSLATDKNIKEGPRGSIFPRASLTFINVASSGTLPSRQALMLDQDTGGGIRAAGRADIYMGQGPAAGERAGQEFAQGRLYYIFLKPELIPGGAGPSTPRLPTPTSTPRTTPTRPAPSGGDMFPGAVRPG